MSSDHKDIGHKLWESEWQTDGEPYGEPGEQQRNMQKVVYDSKDPNVRYTMSGYAKPDGQKDKYDGMDTPVFKEQRNAHGNWEIVHTYDLQKDGSLKTWGKDAKGEWTPPGSRDRPIVNANPADDPLKFPPTPPATKPSPSTQQGSSPPSDTVTNAIDGIIDGVRREVKKSLPPHLSENFHLPDVANGIRSLGQMATNALGDLQAYAGHREPHGQINTGMPAALTEPSGGTPGNDVLASSIGGINGLTNGFGWSEKPLATADQSATTTQKNTTAGKPSPKSGLRLSV